MHNMLCPTMLQYVELKCCNHLAGAVQLSMLDGPLLVQLNLPVSGIIHHKVASLLQV